MLGAGNMGKLPSFDLHFSLKIGKQNHQLRINRQEKLEVKESRKWQKNSEKGKFRKKQTNKKSKVVSFVIWNL